MIVPLYRRLLGAKFDDLPPQVRALHDVTGTVIWAGCADVERGRSIVNRAVAAFLSLPPQGRDQPLRVTFKPVGGQECWSRSFGGAVFGSIQYERNGLLHERVGPTTFVFALRSSSDGLALELIGQRVLGIPLPRILHPAIRTFESEQDGRYRFEVDARLPVFGLLVRYAGWLERTSAESSA